MDDLIRRQDAIDMFQNLAYDDWNQGVSTTWANAYSESAEMIRDLPSAQTVDAVPKSELFELFDQITTAWNGKQRFFRQDDGTIYDRNKCDYIKSFEDAVNRFCEELEME